MTYTVIPTPRKLAARRRLIRVSVVMVGLAAMLAIGPLSGLDTALFWGMAYFAGAFTCYLTSAPDCTHEDYEGVSALRSRACRNRKGVRRYFIVCGRCGSAWRGNQP